MILSAVVCQLQLKASGFVFCLFVGFLGDFFSAAGLCKFSILNFANHYFENFPLAW